MDKITLKAEKREVKGRKVKALRRQGVVPANVYGKGVDSLTISIKAEDFDAAYEQAGETGLIELSVDSQKRPVLISNVQVHPVTNQALHVDFRQVDLKEKIMASVPLEVVGEAPSEKSGIGTVVTQIDEVEVEALPTDFPESIQVDISILTEVDQAIYVKDLVYDRSKLTIQDDPDQIVVKVEPPQKEEEVIAPAPAEEGEQAPKEGEQAPAAEAETPAEEKAQEA